MISFPFLIASINHSNPVWWEILGHFYKSKERFLWFMLNFFFPCFLLLIFRFQEKFEIDLISVPTILSLMENYSKCDFYEWDFLLEVRHRKFQSEESLSL